MSATTGMLRSALGYAPWAIGLAAIGVGIGFGRDKLNQRTAEKALEERWAELETCLVGPLAYDSESERQPDPAERFRRIAMSPNPAVRDSSPNGWPTRCRTSAENVLGALRSLPRTKERDDLRTSLESALPKFGGLELHDDIAVVFGHARALALEASWGSLGVAAPSPHYTNALTFPGSLRVPIESVVRDRHSVVIEGENPRLCQVFDHSPTIDCVPMARGVVPIGELYQSDHVDAYAKFTLIVPADGGFDVVDGATGARLAKDVSPDNVHIPSTAPGEPLPVYFLRRLAERDTGLFRTVAGKTETLVPSFNRSGKPSYATDMFWGSLVGGTVWSRGKKGWESQPIAPFSKKLTPIGDRVEAVAPDRVAHHRCVHDGETMVVTGTNEAPHVAFGRENAWTIVASPQPIDLYGFSSPVKFPKTIRCREKVVDITWLKRVPAAEGDRFPTVVPKRVLCDHDGCTASEGSPVTLYGAGKLAHRDGKLVRTAEDEATLVGLSDGNLLLVWMTPLVGVRARVGAIGRLNDVSDLVLSDIDATGLYTFGSGDDVTVLFSNAELTSGVKIASNGNVVPLVETSFASKVPE